MPFFTQKSFTLFVAGLYMLYGLSKLVIILLTYIISEEQLRKNPLTSLLIHKDHTLAGVMYEIVFGIFAVFSMLYAFALYESAMRPKKQLFAVLLKPHLETYFMVILGVFLVVFYMLVIYTNLPIQKNKNYQKVYWYMGVGGGISFIVFPLLFELVAYMFPVIEKLSLATKALVTIIAVVIITFVFGLLMYKFYKPYIAVKEEADKET
jgi:hypothetical protein